MSAPVPRVTRLMTVLRPENNAYPVIRPKGDAEIFGVVVGLFRKYR